MLNNDVLRIDTQSKSRHSIIMLKSSTSFIVVLISSSVALAELHELKMDKTQKVPKSRVLFEGAKVPNPLERIRLAQSKNEFSKCVELIRSHRGKYTSIAQWMSLNELQCLSKIESPNKEQIAQLVTAAQRVEGEREWLLFGPQSEHLKKSLIESKFVHLNYQMKAAPQNAWRWAEDLLKWQEWMSEEQKAEAFKLAGELAFLRQKLTAAKRYIERSLEIKEDEKLRARLNAVESALKTTDATAKSQGATLVQGKDEKLEATEKELQLFERMQVALRSGDIVAAVEDGIDLIEKFPWGTRASWAADRIYESYSNVVSKTDPNYMLLKTRVLKQMLKADGKRLSDWAQQAFRIGQYNDSYELAQQALEKIKDVMPTTQILMTAARSAQFIGEDRQARKLFQQVVTQHAGTSEARWALFYTGLIDFRNKQYPSAVAAFERLLVLPKSEDIELESRYWLWRALQQVDQNRAKIEGEGLVARFPFTYYGLRALGEMNNQQVELQNLKQETQLSTRFWVTETEKKSWERIQVLLAGGWWQEAQYELEQFPHPKDPVVRSYLAHYWASAFGYPRAIKLWNDSWDQDPRTREQPFFEAAFPSEFEKIIERESVKNNLDKNWVKSLIRQESAWNYRARSRSNALGLMQMIPPTAEEVAADLKIKGLKLPEDLFDPEKNIIFCTYYLAKVLRGYAGHLPLALASYNAGPTRIKRWVEGRGLTIEQNSDPVNEIWIDEMPWSETRFYVKAILRNLLLYRALDQSKNKSSDGSRVTLTSPIWRAESVDK